MPSSIVPDLLDMMSDTIIAQPGSVDAFGDWTPSGAALNLTCKLIGGNRLVRDQITGKEVVSTVKAVIGSTPGLSVRGYRYTLPARFGPRTDITAIDARAVTDENGAHHEVVVLP